MNNYPKSTKSIRILMHHNKIFFTLTITLFIKGESKFEGGVENIKKIGHLNLVAYFVEKMGVEPTTS